mmetsp:Transcript_51126/g.147523  ORF Transcript_51126/g.147523 Transcript_51126/m.147523 type:complete len:282 (+) Transcript_51126:76-921(+)
MYQRFDHGESIYQIVPPEVFIPPKAPMFRSGIPDYPPTASTFHGPGKTHPICSNMAGDATQKIVKDRSHAEFGKPMGTYKSDPGNFMRKMARSSSVPTLREMRKTCPEQLRPTHVKESKFVAMGGGGPPKIGDQPTMGLKKSKNFIVANAVETILAQPRKPVDITKDWLTKEDYGRLPKYLHRVKRNMQREFDFVQQLHEQNYANSQPPIQSLDDAERVVLLEGLKSKWEKKNMEYQAGIHVSVLSDGQKRNREKCEAELMSFEKDIEKLGKKDILVDLSR